MTAFHAGFGGLTPTTMALRTAASVRAGAHGAGRQLHGRGAAARVGEARPP
ncbi:MAG: hypothetical protein R2838_04120 [Caldilineaceae bacterium]